MSFQPCRLLFSGVSSIFFVIADLKCLCVVLPAAKVSTTTGISLVKWGHFGFGRLCED